MWILLMLILILFLFLAIMLWIRSSIEKTEEKKCYDAAARMIKENSLNELILSKGTKRTAENKLMICLTTEGKKKQRFIFDPQKGIRIGRDSQGNEICIRNQLVSSSHCCIYLYQGNPIIQDYHSANGTWIRRGWKTYRVEETAAIFSGDRLLIGDIGLKVRIFMFDMTQL